MSASAGDWWRYEHGVGPLPSGPVICQVCGEPLARGLEKHPGCQPRVVPPGVPDGR